MSVINSIMFVTQSYFHLLKSSLSLKVLGKTKIILRHKAYLHV